MVRYHVPAVDIGTVTLRERYWQWGYGKIKMCTPQDQDLIILGRVDGTSEAGTLQGLLAVNVQVLLDTLDLQVQASGLPVGAELIGTTYLKCTATHQYWCCSIEYMYRLYSTWSL